jgi:hypothetical protein
MDISFKLSNFCKIKKKLFITEYGKVSGKTGDACLEAHLVHLHEKHSLTDFRTVHCIFLVLNPSHFSFEQTGETSVLSNLFHFI